MHTALIPESSGETSGPVGELEDCRYCGKKRCVQVFKWESSDGAYEDYKFDCSECGKVWWEEGIDA